MRITSRFILNVKIPSLLRNVIDIDRLYLIGKRVVQKLCEFISNLCTRDARFHSRDMHSILVAAFYSLGCWLSQFPIVLFDRDTRFSVLETIEFAISGDFSSPKNKV